MLFLHANTYKTQTFCINPCQNANRIHMIKDLFIKKTLGQIDKEANNKHGLKRHLGL